MDTATSTGSRTRSATRSVERQESWHARTISLATSGSTPATGTPRSTACDQYSANHRPAWNEYTNRRGGWSWSTGAALFRVGRFGQFWVWSGGAEREPGGWSSGGAGLGWESAGINRHEGGDGRALRRRASDPRRPRVMRRRPVRAWRSVDRG